MCQPFRLLVTGSRTWDDVRAIEQALAVILARHPEGYCWCMARARAQPTPSPPTRPGPPVTRSRRIPPASGATGELQDTAGTRR
jgi:hypothetical protein